MNLIGKNAIVTGGGRGIGLAIGKKLVQEGCNLIIVESNKSLKNKILNCFKTNYEKVIFLESDIGDPIAREKIFSKELHDFAPIDILINNARYKNKFQIEEPEHEWEKAIKISLSAPFFLSQKFIKQSKKGGVIINICSPAAFLATAESPSYHAAKGGLLSLTKYLSVFAGDKEIRVNAISPGFIVQNKHLPKYNSRENKDYRNLCEFYQPMGKVGTEEDVSELVSFLCSDRSKYLSGACIDLDGAATNQEQFSLIKKLYL